MTADTTLAMYQVDAFTDRVFSGNPAAVLILEDWLPDTVMQSISAENNLSETAFARRNGSRWDLRWFTPAVEVDFCGHATLATAHVLATEYGIAGDMVFATRVGDLRAAPCTEGYRLDFPCLAPEDWAELPEAVADLFPSGFVRTVRSFDNIFVELQDEASVRDFVPDFERIAKLGLQGLVITAKGASDDFVSRYFAPGAGIPEDPVTGSIHSTLTPYWAERLGKTRLSARQVSRRGGHLVCELAGERVAIFGQAVTFMKAEIRLGEG
ncbi:PhzF family phenazine biosynthesis protein [Consotaella aegiceratis]|uniref:PhzF family phenazine biosynthesis protein n=1 Tax=Consotaella aegiceratis TaxID=3097961 RepID=UPI002F42CC0E